MSAHNAESPDLGELVELHLDGGDRLRVARLSGEIDFSNALTIGAALLELPNTLHTLVVDLADVAYMDSAGIGMLHELSRRLDLRAQRLVVVVPPGRPPRRVLELSGVPERLRLVESLEEATAKAPASLPAARADGSSPRPARSAR